MATKTARKVPPQPDPSAAANRKVLADRQRLIDAQAPPVKPVHVESTADTAIGFLTDEFDRRYFGDVLPTVSRVVYGPDSLLDDPDFKERVEKFGVEEVALAVKEAILDKGARAFTNPQMASIVQRAIRKFDLESVASSMYDRVMRIPCRTVEVEVDREDEMLGNPLREAVNRHGTPGFAAKFMSEQCIAQLGMRGYRIVREHGEPVKVGTLIMTEIPLAIAERRQAQYVKESEDNVREAEENYQASVEKVMTASKAGGAAALTRDEIVNVSASETESFLGQARGAGIEFEREIS